MVVIMVPYGEGVFTPALKGDEPETSYDGH
jgi:hypothetical protein